MKYPKISQSELNTIIVVGVCACLLLAVFTYFYKIKQTEGFEGSSDWDLVTENNDVVLKYNNESAFKLTENGEIENATVTDINKALGNLETRLDDRVGKTWRHKVELDRYHKRLEAEGQDVDGDTNKCSACPTCLTGVAASAAPAGPAPAPAAPTPAAAEPAAAEPVAAPAAPVAAAAADCTNCNKELSRINLGEQYMTSQMWPTICPSRKNANDCKFAGGTWKGQSPDSCTNCNRDAIRTGVGAQYANQPIVTTICPSRGNAADCAKAGGTWKSASAGAPTFFHTGCNTWQGARNECLVKNGDLVVINTAMKNAQVMQFVKSNNQKCSGQGPYPWIGAKNCKRSGNKCDWVDGSPWKVFGDDKFKVDDPYAHVYTNDRWGTWGNSGSNKARGICELK